MMAFFSLSSSTSGSITLETTNAGETPVVAQQFLYFYLSVDRYHHGYSVTLSLRVLDWSLFWGLVFSGFLFKIIVAALDTPLLYLGVAIFRRKFNLEVGQEIQLD